MRLRTLTGGMKGPQAEEVEEWRLRHIKREEQKELD